MYLSVYNFKLMKFCSMILHVSYGMVGKKLWLAKDSSMFFVGGKKGIMIFTSFGFISFFLTDE